MSDLVSIIVPVYNAKSCLKRCVDSILNQTYHELEIILVDDGSTDGSGAICDECAQRDGRVVVLHQGNSGPSIARKNGIRMAHGDYLGFVDADDNLLPNFISTLYDVIYREKVDFVHSGYYQNEVYVGCAKEERIDISDSNKLSVICDRLLGKNVDRVLTPSIWSKLYSKELIEKVGELFDDDLDYGEDLLFVCHCLLNANSVYVLNKAFYNYTVSDESLSHRCDESQIKKEVRLYNKLEDVLQGYLGNELLEKTLSYFLLSHIYMGLNSHPKLKGTIQRYFMPNISGLFNKNIALYGAGKVGRDYYLQLRQYSECNLVAWVDKNAKKIDLDYCEVMSPNDLINVDFDVIVIAVASQSQSELIKKDLVNMGIRGDCIFWEEPVNRFA